MTHDMVEAVADTLEEARAKVKRELPAGKVVLSETVVSDGGPTTTTAAASTIEEANQRAMDRVPEGAEVLSTRVVSPPQQVTVSIDALDEAEARRKLVQQKGESAIVQGLQLAMAGKKGFLGIGRTPNRYTLQVFLPSQVAVDYHGRAVISVTVGAKSERDAVALKMAEDLAGGWPIELPRYIFNKVDLDKLCARLKDYQEGEYPGISMSNQNKPIYQMIGGRLGRASNPVQDIKLVNTASMLRGRSIAGFADFEGMARMALQVIEHYAQTRLARFLFLLPRACETAGTVAAGGQALVSPDTEVIGIHKGVELVLMEIYEELDEDQTFGDAEVTHKLREIVDSARTE